MSLKGCPIVARASDSSIPTRALIASEDFSPRLRASAVAAAIASGLRARGGADPDVVPLETLQPGSRAGFDARMRAARAVIIAVPTLDPATIARTPAFEIATRARQAGVPAYAIARESRMSSFDARVLDLQLVLLARGGRGLATAGSRIGDVI
jgi:glycerate 2-kinase